MSEAPASSFTKYHWSDRQEEPGSELRTSSGCGHQLENLKEKHTKYNKKNFSHNMKYKQNRKEVFPKKV